MQGLGVNSAGDYWHAIMHRREPDYSNGKYWFRAVGSHPVFPELASRAEALFQTADPTSGRWRDRLMAAGEWDPFAFVDLCAECPRNEGDALSLFARRLQWLEMCLLLRETYRDMTGS